MIFEEITHDRYGDFDQFWKTIMAVKKSNLQMRVSEGQCVTTIVTVSVE